MATQHHRRRDPRHPQLPLLRYAITTAALPEADAYMFVGRVNNEPWIEVAAEDVDGTLWAVFHAMILRARIADEVFQISGGTIDMRNDLAPQRPYIGPQYREEI
jgi:hypothetical protein